MNNINPAQINSIHIANSVGAPNKAPILVTDEYNHWVTRFKGYIEGKDEEIWRSIVKGPHKPTLQRPATEAEAALGGAVTVTLTQDDLLKLKADKQAVSELNCAIPPDVFDLVEECVSAHETWNTLHQLFEGTEAAKDKKMTSAINAFSSFKALPSESLQETFKRFKVCISRLKNSGDVKSNLEINLKFINSLGEAWITVQMIIQGSGKLSKMSLYELFNDLQAQESTVLSNSVRSGGPLALLSADTVGETSDHASQKTRTKTQVVAEACSLSYEDSEEDDDEEEAFQQELALLT